MITSIPKIEMPKNEPNLTYGPGSKEKAELKAKLKELSRKKIDIPCVIDGQERPHGKDGPLRHARTITSTCSACTTRRASARSRPRSRRPWPRRRTGRRCRGKPARPCS